MADFRNNSRLFPHSSRTNQEREAARRAQSILEQMQRELRNPTTATNRNIREQSRRLADAVRSAGGRVPVAGQLLDLASTAGRLAESFQKSMLNQTLEALGTPGHLIQSWLRGREGALSLRPLRETVDRAIGLMNQINPEMFGDDGPQQTPEQAGGRRTFVRKPLRPVPIPNPATGQPNPYAPTNPGGAGSPQQNPSPSPAGGGGSGNRLPPQPPDDSQAGPHRNVRVLPDGRIEIRAPGYHRVLAADDPVLSGQMQRVQSSNVYGIGFEFNFDEPLRSKLIVRYLQNNRRGSGKVGGPTYEYFDVHPDWFADLVAAGSKGGWVWDHLRIRGTVAGHQYRYNLSRIAQGYLPRRAMVYAGIQRLVRRNRTFVQGGRTQSITSPLPDRVLGRYSPPRGSAANVGNRDRAVDRGIPNRGAPARGLFR